MIYGSTRRRAGDREVTLSYVRQAEKNVVARAKAYNDALEFVDALVNFGNRACREHVGKPKFFEGLQMLRDAIRAEQSEAIRECFYLSGVGGKEAERYSKELFKEVFGGDCQIMSFLDKWGQLPSWYKTEDREAFQRECDDVIKYIEEAE